MVPTIVQFDVVVVVVFVVVVVVVVAVAAVVDTKFVLLNLPILL
jgi:hypothetical protein